jgi:hypothetical protein
MLLHNCAVNFYNAGVVTQDHRIGSRLSLLSMFSGDQHEATVLRRIRDLAAWKLARQLHEAGNLKVKI